MKKEKNAKQSIFNEKYEIVLYTPHSNARCPSLTFSSQPRRMAEARDTLRK